MTPERLKTILEQFAGKRILVLGDLMLDHYFWGPVHRISPEAPVPVVAVESETFLPGGAANVIHNLHLLGAEVAAAGVIGNDIGGEKLQDCLRAENVDLGGVVTDGDRPTTTKMRIMAHSRQHQNQQIVRVDHEVRTPVSGSVLEALKKTLQNTLNADAIYISDYAKGTVTHNLMDAVRETLRTSERPVVVDPKGRNFEKYHGVTAISPNQAEALGAFNLDAADGDTVLEVGHRLVKQFEIPQVYITRSEKGVALFEPDGKCTQIPATAREVFDVSGAGDTTAAVYTLALVSGATPAEAAHIGNLAGGISVGKVGVASVTKDELLEATA